MTHLTVVVPPVVRTPRGAEWVGALVETYKAFVTASRATSLVKQRGSNAVAVRQYADSIRVNDPGMAADLYAAVDRHTG